MQKTALIIGITGQDGGILADILRHKGYCVHGIRPYSATPDTHNLDPKLDIQLHYGDLTDAGNIRRLIEHIQPNEIYNLGAMSHVGESFNTPLATANINALGTLRILEALRDLQSAQDIRLYQASSSELFGNAPAPQNEQTPFAPCSPYATAKLFAYWSVRNYRDSYGIFASNGILFNHESAQRGDHFVTQKIVNAIANIKKGHQECLHLGNLDSKRDWGHARDYMMAAHAILNHGQADDFVIASGQAHTVREFATRAFVMAGYELEWRYQHEKEQAIDIKTGAILVRVDPALYRPNEVNCLRGDATKARQELGWEPTMSLDNLIEEMLNAAIAR